MLSAPLFEGLFVLQNTSKTVHSLGGSVAKATKPIRIARADSAAKKLTAQTTGKNAKVKANGEFTTGKGSKKNTPEKSKSDHFERHGKEFKNADGNPKYKNADDYAKGAKEFLNNPPKGTLTKVRDNGDVVRFNEKSGELVSVNKVGKVKTYFAPSKTFAYGGGLAEFYIVGKIPPSLSHGKWLTRLEVFLWIMKN